MRDGAPLIAEGAGVLLGAATELLATETPTLSSSGWDFFFLRLRLPLMDLKRDFFFFLVEVVAWDGVMDSSPILI